MDPSSNQSKQTSISRVVMILLLLLATLLIIKTLLMWSMTGTHCPTHPFSDAITLKAALQAYRHEYGNWPCDSTQAIVRFDTSATLAEILSDDTNSAICPKMNPKHIHFISPEDYGPNLTDPWGRPFHILIDLTNDTCEVTFDKKPVRRKGCGG